MVVILVETVVNARGDLRGISGVLTLRQHFLRKIRHALGHHWRAS